MQIYDLKKPLKLSLVANLIWQRQLEIGKKIRETLKMASKVQLSPLTVSHKAINY